MKKYKLGVVESKFADIIWANEPLTTAELVALCERELQWKRTTTYTVLKKLGEYGIFKMQDKIVTSLVSREDYYAVRSEQFVEETFEGSLPAFIAAFTKRKALTAEEIEEIRNMIDTAEQADGKAYLMKRINGGWEGVPAEKDKMADGKAHLMKMSKQADWNAYLSNVQRTDMTII